MGTLFYIPEFLSSSNTEKARRFKALCKETGWKFVPLDWPSCDPTKIYVTFNKILLDNLHDVNNIIVGTGMGGFWANFFAKEFLAKTVLINPCLNPSSKLWSFLPEQSDVILDNQGLPVVFTEEMIDKYSLYESLIRSHYGTVIYLSKDDPLENWKTSNLLFKETDDVCVRKFPIGCHSMMIHISKILEDTKRLMDIPYYALPHELKKFREALTL